MFDKYPIWYIFGVISILISMSASSLILPPGLVHFQSSHHLPQHEEVIFIWNDFSRSRTSPTEPISTWVWRSGRRRRKMQARPLRWTQKMQRWLSTLFLGERHWYQSNIYCYHWNQISIIEFCPALTWTLEYCYINRALSPGRLQAKLLSLLVESARLQWAWSTKSDSPLAGFVDHIRLILRCWGKSSMVCQQKSDAL